jgi:amino acid adenylation domain-containing protein/non-ribosomal peptide synthase protein (TIGR01720 family)
MGNKNFLKEVAFDPEHYTKERKYWHEKLSGNWVRTNFNYDYFEKEDVSITEIDFKFPGPLSEKLIRVSNQSDSRLHMILSTGLALLMYKYTGNQDFLMGIPIDKQEIEGNFINTVLPLRIRLIPNMTFKEMLLQVRETIIEAAEHQNYPVETIPYELNIPVVEDEFPLFDVAILLRNIHDESYLQHIKINLTFSFLREQDSLKGIVKYNPGLYEKEKVNRIIGYFSNLMENIFENPDARISGIPILDEKEKKQLLYDFNDSQMTYPADKTIVELFRQQVERTPDNNALIEAKTGRTLTYNQLNRKVRQLAALLKARGAIKGTIVPVMGRRNIEIVIGILGILHTGAVYLPIDATNPEERIKYIIRDSNAYMILIQTHLIDKIREALSHLAREKIIDIEESSIFSTDSLEPDIKDINPGDPAYIIYTSGTTGKPRGVMIRHQALVNYITWADRFYVRNQAVNFPLFTSISFDLTMTSIFTPLISGNAAVLYRDDEKKMLIERIVDDDNVGVIKLTPSHLYLLKYKKIAQSRIKRFIVGGEELHRQLARDIYTNFDGNIEIYNEYGPTETTVGCMIHQFDPDADNRSAVPIGIPSGNSQIYILDDNLEVVPVGVIGEIYISGDGIAHGYINRPELTAEKFVKNPFVPKKQMYRSGDLARRLPRGLIEFLGREDNQVKIRGNRVELEEIEHCLLTCENVKEAVVGVSVDSEGVKSLAAYFVPAKEIDLTTLRTHLEANLPEHMMPHYFVQLDEIPRTASGKIDRDSLPEPGGMIINEEKYEAPRNESEKKLVEVWEEVLGVTGVGINDNFFGIGGDSIKSIQIAARLQKHNMKVDVADLFLYQTIGQLSQYVKKCEQVIDQGLVEGKVQLTPIQEWFFENKFAHNHHYNQSVMLYREDGFDETVLRSVFSEIIKHHDALRMVYKTDGDNVVQQNRGIEGQLFHLEIIPLDDQKGNIEEIAEKEADRLQGSIDLINGPLVKLGLFKTNHGDHLLIVIHHLAVDGVSWRILFEDFANAHQQIETGQAIKLQDKTHSYKYWAEKLQEYAKSEQLLSELDYWRKINETKLGSLVKDSRLNTGKRRFGDSETVTMVLNKKYTEQLLREVNQAFATEINDILLTALGLSIKEWVGITKITVNMEGHGRESIIEDVNINRTVGWFTSLYPVLLDVSEDKGLNYHIKFIKDTLRHIPNKGTGYGILRYLTPDEKKEGTNFILEPEISFNYLGQIDEDINQGIIKISPLNSGKTVSPRAQRPHAINIVGIIDNGQLNMSFTYDIKEFQRNRIEALSSCYQSKLEEIIEYCRARQEQELTPGDLDYSELSIEELDELKNLTGDID